MSIARETRREIPLRFVIRFLFLYRRALECWHSYFFWLRLRRSERHLKLFHFSIMTLLNSLPCFKKSIKWKIHRFVLLADRLLWLHHLFLLWLLLWMFFLSLIKSLVSFVLISLLICHFPCHLTGAFRSWGRSLVLKVPISTSLPMLIGLFIIERIVQAFLIFGWSSFVLLEFHPVARFLPFSFLLDCFRDINLLSIAVVCNNVRNWSIHLSYGLPAVSSVATLWDEQYIEVKLL